MLKIVIKTTVILLDFTYNLARKICKVGVKFALKSSEQQSEEDSIRKVCESQRSRSQECWIVSRWVMAEEGNARAEGWAWDEEDRY